MTEKQSKNSKGGARIGAGRPKGARNLRPSRVEIDSHGSTKKLEALGFDPIEAHIKSIEEIDKIMIVALEETGLLYELNEYFVEMYYQLGDAINEMNYTNIY